MNILPYIIIFSVVLFCIFIGCVALAQSRREKIEDDRRRLKEAFRARIEIERRDGM